MKQKIPYILLLIAAFLGRGEMAWGQTGYNETPTGPYTRSQSFSDNTYVKDNMIVLTNETQIINNVNASVKFTVNNIRYYINGGVQLIKGEDYVILWEVLSPYYINLTGFSARVKTSGAVNQSITFTPTEGKAFSGKINWDGGTISSTELNLGNNSSIGITVGSSTPWYYFQSLSFTYTLSYYELDLTELNNAISTANAALLTITDETMKGYLNTAIATADDQTFRSECAFPNSYWYKNSNNEVSEGKRKPSEVTDRANKLNAVTNYLLTRTAANAYADSDVPNAVYQELHPYDHLNPNDYTTVEVNGATDRINTGIDMANMTTEAYKRAMTTITTAETNNEKNSPQGVATADINTAKTQLEKATTVDAINAALANIKRFDKITFSETSEIVEGSVVNPATASSGKTVTYTSSDNKVIAVEGTMLRAVGAGTATITASTETENGYYAYQASKTYTVTPQPKELVLTDGNLPKVGEKYTSITLKRTLSGICTLTLPFTTSIGEIAPRQTEAWAAQLALVTYNKADGYTLYFRKTDGTITANQPYVVNIPVAVTNKVWERNIELTEEPSAKSVKCNVVGNNGVTMEWTMQGNYETRLPMKGKYGIAGGKLCLGGEGSFINAYTAYFENRSAQQNVQTRVAILNEQGDATHIGDVKGGVLMVTTSVNSPDSVQHKQSRKGVNVVKGKDGTSRKILK